MSEFTHIDAQGNAIMVDIHEKKDTYRYALACGSIWAKKEVLLAIKEHTIKKGDVLSVAQIAGIMAAKKNAELIPLCHNIPLTNCKITFEMDENAGKIVCTSQVSCFGKTGAEMEALTAVSVALLTIYDMCKAIDRSMKIGEIQLLEKDGGKSGMYRATERMDTKTE